MIKLCFPFTTEKIRALKVGDEVLISGVVFTNRTAPRLAGRFQPR
jgi:tartrate dehydratase beta subunit/fumarate hydratase class I family protein